MKRVSIASSVALRVLARPAQRLTHKRHLSFVFPRSTIKSPLSQSKGWNVRNFSSYPQHLKLTMPALSPTGDTCDLVSWTKKVGDKVKPGDMIAECQTDKSTIAFTSMEEGYIAKFLVADGTTKIPIGQLVAIMVDNKEDVAAFADFTGEDAPSSPEASLASSVAPTTSSSQSPSVASAAGSAGGSRVLASPKAVRLAKEHGLKLADIPGTGGSVNRITSQDVLSYTPVKQAQQAEVVQAKPPAGASSAAPVGVVSPAGDFTDIPHSNIRKAIATRLTQSKQQIPHYYLSMECRVDSLLKLREAFNAKRDKDTRLSVNDFIIKAAALALRAVPEVNSTWMDTCIRQFQYVDISVAVMTPTGLITPIVVDADNKGLDAISSKVKELGAKAKANKLQPNEFLGGTFTISNLGMFGITSFSAIINPPQAAILAVGTTTQRLVPSSKECGFEEASILTVQLSCDHRVIDGAVGARWLQAFKGYLEDPPSMLL